MITNYRIKTIDNIVCLPGTGILRAVVDIFDDISDIFPYINGYAKKAKYLPKIPWIRFPFYSFSNNFNKIYDVACKPKELIIGKFNSADEAKKIVDEVVYFINDIYQNKEKIIPSSKEWAPPSVLTIIKYLPQTNCGRCGEKSCMAFAVKLAQDDIEPEVCREIKEENLLKLKQILY